MSLSQKTKDAVEDATASLARVTDRARMIMNAIANRPTRARTNPFVKIEADEFDEEDSMVSTIEKVISTQSNSAIEVQKEE